ncbi:unnamed protein product [Linum tenue]|uniref:Transcription initiation factor TFIID component TAF4 C-terminal domain-containing protein n=1 Tax=Linum tenue TaxID=586396 RepID=A0AAV0MZY3_9ROSI|nr:unnamed protein product [Linum tenue]
MRCRRELRRRPHKRFPPLPSSRATSALVLEGRILMVCNTMCMMYTTITLRGVANAAMPSRKNPSWTSTRRNGVISIPPPLIFQAMAAAGNRRGQELLGVPVLPFSSYACRSLAWILLLDLETWDPGGPCYRSLTVLWSADGFGHFPWKIASMESVNGDAVDFGKKNAVQEAPPKKPSFGQKKQLEAVGSSPAPASKKQKVSGALSDKSIDQLNDVTAVSGVNLQKEEEQLFSTNKEDSRVSKASRRAVQEDEERLILQKTPLQKKVAEIMSKCGLKNASNDVDLDVFLERGGESAEFDK